MITISEVSKSLNWIREKVTCQENCSNEQFDEFYGLLGLKSMPARATANLCKIPHYFRFSFLKDIFSQKPQKGKNYRRPISLIEKWP